MHMMISWPLKLQTSQTELPQIDFGGAERPSYGIYAVETLTVYLFSHFLSYESEVLGIHQKASEVVGPINVSASIIDISFR